MTPPEPPIPLFQRIEIESQAHCNRDCWFCARTHDRSGSYLDAEGKPVRGRMATETVLDLLDQAAGLGFAGEIAFHHYSEPLLDERNIEFARAAAARGMRPYLHTNGDVLRSNNALAADVVDVYTRVVVGLYDYASDAELAEAKAFWQDRLAGVELDFMAIKAGGGAGVPSMALHRPGVPGDPRVGRPEVVFPNGPCLRPMIRMIVRHDGEMMNCCCDTAGAFELGNVHDATMEELWHSPRHVQVVRDLQAGRREDYPLCRVCPEPPSTQRADGVQIRIALRK